ncbi:MAG: hypothetical protein ACHBN1_01635 [Heteroscytonema crispum UTEX LB 1556]
MAELPVIEAAINLVIAIAKFDPIAAKIVFLDESIAMIVNISF